MILPGLTAPFNGLARFHSTDNTSLKAKLSGGAKRGGLAPGAGRVASARLAALPS